MKSTQGWPESPDALPRTVQVAFDVETSVLEAVRRAAFRNDLSNSDQIRHLLGLPVSGRPKRPRLTVTLTLDDYAALAARYGLPAENRRAIKERAAQELAGFANGK